MGERFVVWHRRNFARHRSRPRLWQAAALSRQSFGSIFTVLSLLSFAFFAYGTFYLVRQVPASTSAPRVGEKAPEFTLPDQRGKQVALADLLAGKGALLIFYRGHW